MSMCDEGCVAVVPYESDVDPNINDSYNIYSMRVGRVVQWSADYVTVDIYDDRICLHKNLRVA